jgi:hypothetical protein
VTVKSASSGLRLWDECWVGDPYPVSPRRGREPPRTTPFYGSCGRKGYILPPIAIADDFKPTSGVSDAVLLAVDPASGAMSGHIHANWIGQPAECPLLRIPSGRCRREADIADAGLERRSWADTAPTAVAPGRTGAHAEAVISSRARKVFTPFARTLVASVGIPA